MSLPAVSQLAKQLAKNWEATGGLGCVGRATDEEEEEEELTCLSWLHTTSPRDTSTCHLPAPPLPPKHRANAESPDPLKDLLSKKFQIQQKTSVKKLCQHYKFLLKVSFYNCTLAASGTCYTRTTTNIYQNIINNI